MEGARKTGRLLIADDDPVALEVLDEILSDGGFAVQRACDGREAWQYLHDDRDGFDAVILDRSMPHLDGLAVLSRMKLDARLRDLPVVLQTGAGSAEEVEEGLRAGVYYYLVKPYDPSLLRAVVEAAIRDVKERHLLLLGLAERARALNLLYSGRFHCRTPDDARDLSTLLASACDNPDAVVVGLSELLLNAVEHGNLNIRYEEKSELLKRGMWQEELEGRLRSPEYRHRVVDVSVERGNGTLTFNIVDQGNGFNPAAYLQFDTERATHAHGRGIAIARMMSFQSMQYLGRGNHVVATAAARAGGNAYNRT